MSTTNGQHHRPFSVNTLDVLTANAVHWAVPPLPPQPPSSSPVRSRQVEQLLVNFLQARIDRFRRLADPRRDIAAECGHPRTYTIEQYQDLYDRDGIAARVVEVYPAETWKVTPSVYEDEDTSNPTAFEAAWDALGTQLRGGSKLVQEEGSPVWEALRAADVESGIGRYGIILLGFDDNPDLSQPVIPRKGQRLLYLRAVPEAWARASQWDQNAGSPRFSQPTMYQITFGDPSQQTATEEGSAVRGSGAVEGVGLVSKEVHWTRCIHVCDGGVTYARPRLRQVLPYVLDCAKILGSDAEAFWQNVTGDTYFETDPSLGGDVVVDGAGVKSEYEKMLQGMQRGMMLNGVTAKKLLPQMADPLPHLMAQIQAICIKIDCPQRTFLGSELGRLAADQDAQKWRATARSRRILYATPRMVAPLVDRLIWAGVLPEPQRYYVTWPDAEAQTEDEKAGVALKLSQALAAYVQSGAEAVMPPADYLIRVWGWNEEEAAAVMENAQGLLAEMRAEEAVQQQQQAAAMAQGGATADAGGMNQ